MAADSFGSKHLEGCVYCGEGSCQEHFEREPEEKVSALLAALLQDGAEYYADVLENQGYGPDLHPCIGGVELLGDAAIEIVADGEKVVVEVRVGGVRGGGV